MKAFQIGQAVILVNGVRGFVREQFHASDKGAQRDMAFYTFENATNGTRYTVGHSEIKPSDIDAAPDEIKFAQEALNLYPDASPFWDSTAGQDVMHVARLNGLKASNTNRDRCRIHGELMRQANQQCDEIAARGLGK